MACNLFGENDQCSSSVQALFARNYSVLPYIYSGDCPTRLNAYATECSEIFGGNDNEVRT